MNAPAIFLDRDGVINRDRQFVYRIEDFQFIEGVVDAVREMANRGFKVVVVTNQSGIGRGYYTQQDFDVLNEWMLATLRRQGVSVSGVYHCPHSPDAACECRKPKPGMILQAARELNLCLKDSWMVGDKPSDIAAAHSAGISNTVLVRSGKPVDPKNTAKALFVCDSVPDIIQLL